MKHFDDLDFILYFQEELSKEKMEHLNSCSICKAKLEEEKKFIENLKDFLIKRVKCIPLENLMSYSKNGNFKEEELEHLAYCPLCKIEVEAISEIKKKNISKIPEDSFAINFFKKRMSESRYVFMEYEGKIKIEEGIKEERYKDFSITLKVDKEFIKISITPVPEESVKARFYSESMSKTIEMEKGSAILERGAWKYMEILL